MKRVSTHEMVPGMILEAPIRDQKGRLLIPEGEILTEQHIRICKIWGAMGIWVKTTDPAQESQIDDFSQIPAAVQTEAEQRVRKVFGNNELDEPFLDKLFQLAVHRKARQLHALGQTSSGYAGPGKTWSAYRYQPPRKRPVTMQNLINDRIKLPALPDIYHKTMASIYNVEVPIAEIAQIIGKDPTLSAKVLQLVNSSFYGLLKPVDTLPHALALIGTDQLITIVTGVSVVAVFKDLSSSMLNMRQFWEHSVACGIVCRQLASYMSGVVNSERYFVAGLLHDIGRLAMIQGVPDEMVQCMAKAQIGGLPLAAAEAETLGFDHAQAGAYLAQIWNLPVPLERMIRHHHTPDVSTQNIDPSVIAIGDFIVTALEVGVSGNAFLPPFSRQTWEKLELNPNILENMILQLEHQLNDTFVLIYGA